MTDPADRHLEERLHALARGLSVPMVAVEDDVRRGRRRLLRLRVAMAGATTGTLAVVLGLTALTAGDPTATEPPLVGRPSSVLPSTPDGSPSAEVRSPDGGSDPHAAGNGGTGGVGSPGGAGPTGSPDGLPVQGLAGATAGRDPGAGTGALSPTGKPTRGPEASDPASDPAGDVAASGSATAPATETPSDSTTPSPTEEPTDPATVPPTESSPVRVTKVLRYYRDVLAEHIDPRDDHLQGYERTSGHPRSSRKGDTFYALGATYGWTEHGRDGTVAVLVASGWDQLSWACGASYSDWVCHTPDTATDGPAEVALHDGVREVAVEHADGQVVVVTSSDVGADEDELVAAAADERLTLPGEAAVSPPRLDADTFADAGEAGLVRGEESFDRSAFDRSPLVRGTWTVDGAAQGALAWSARPLYSEDGWSCLPTYRRCSDVVVDDSGTTVHVGLLKTRAGGGWVVEYDGASYAVRVAGSDRSFPKKRAYAFVTQDDWQPTR